MKKKVVKERNEKKKFAGGGKTGGEEKVGKKKELGAKKGRDVIEGWRRNKGWQKGRFREQKEGIKAAGEVVVGGKKENWRREESFKEGVEISKWRGRT